MNLEEEIFDTEQRIDFLKQNIDLYLYSGVPGQTVALNAYYEIVQLEKKLQALKRQNNESKKLKK